MLGWLESIVLGIVQGLTEFLPVSSSGHLVVVPALFGWKQPSLTFDLVLHFGTLIAVVFAFRRELWTLFLAVFGKGDDVAGSRRLIWLLFIASIPAAIAGIALGNFFEERFDDPTTTCIELLATAALLLGAEWIIRRGEGHEEIDTSRAGADRRGAGGRHPPRHLAVGFHDRRRTEQGVVTLVGATTENPSFEINAALLSRAQVFVLKRLDDAALDQLLQRAETLMGAKLPLTEDARIALTNLADGDGRYLLTLAEELFALQADSAARRQGARRTPAEARARLRQGPRRALQSHLRAAQIHPRLRSRRRALLARAHDRRRRRPALHRAPPRARRRGGHGPRRSHRAADLQRRQGRRAFHRPAGSGAASGASRDPSRHRAQIQRRLRRLDSRPSRRARDRHARPAHAHPQRADQAHEGSRLRLRLQLRPRRRRRLLRPELFSRRHGAPRSSTTPKAAAAKAPSRSGSSTGPS